MSEEDTFPVVPCPTVRPASTLGFQCSLVGMFPFGPSPSMTMAEIVLAKADSGDLVQREV